MHVFLNSFLGGGGRLFINEIQITVIYCRAILVAVTSECCVERVICKTWIGLSAGTLANSADPVKMPRNATSDQCLYCLL